MLFYFVKEKKRCLENREVVWDNMESSNRTMGSAPPVDLQYLGMPSGGISLHASVLM